jgi:Spy/CpxP family protein refolding chaperone
MFNGKFVKTLLIASTMIGLPAMAQGNVEKAQVSQVKVGGQTCARASYEKRGEFGKKLGLTDSQLEKIATLKDQSRIEMAPEYAQMRGLRDQLKVAITKSDVSAQEDMSVQEKINTLHSQIANQKLQEKLNFMAILTPEQRETLRHKMLVSEATGRGGEHGYRAERGERGYKFGHHMNHKFGERPAV